MICESQRIRSPLFFETRKFRLRGYFFAGWFCYESGYFLEPSLNKISEGVAGPFAVLRVFGLPFIFDQHNDNSRLINNLA